MQNKKLQEKVNVFYTELENIKPSHLALVEGLLEYISDLEEVLDDKRRLTRDIDVILNGEDGAAKQASLCDLVIPVKKLVEERNELKKVLKNFEENEKYWQLSV